MMVCGSRGHVVVLWSDTLQTSRAACEWVRQGEHEGHDQLTLHTGVRRGR